ncbi:hypothetical protein [Salinarimonas rosea]|uniref:hypothetical protein n=1 Tax=Salinarimonas rosea TaxID=552063 RepID=UPI00040D1A24|nr:hypothetical protein [Salinarimonas rosea]
MARYSPTAGAETAATVLGALALTSLCPRPGTIRYVETPVDPGLAPAAKKAADALRGLRSENDRLRRENEVLRAELEDLLLRVSRL